MSYLPVILRYGIVFLVAQLAARGLLLPEQVEILGQYTDAIVGALVTLGTVGYALKVRPSDKAMAAAKEIDKEVPKDMTVTILTPPEQDNIIIQPGAKP